MGRARQIPSPGGAKETPAEYQNDFIQRQSHEIPHRLSRLPTRPLGANHISALLRARGHEVEIEIIHTTGDVRDFVAGGVDDFDFDLVSAGAQESGDVVGLPEGELGAARADAEFHGIAVG